jgi:hypothetical protein
VAETNPKIPANLRSAIVSGLVAVLTMIAAKYKLGVSQGNLEVIGTAIGGIIIAQLELLLQKKENSDPRGKSPPADDEPPQS